MGGALLAGVLALLGIASGASLVVQQALLAQLRQGIGSPFWVAFISYAGGTIAMILVLLALREPWIGPIAPVRGSWLPWIAGFFGVLYIVMSILLLPRLGAATTLALVIAGQMSAALIFDHFGLLDVPQHPIDAARVLGAAMLVGGVLLIRL
jgi:transporter family-2 protein